MALASPYLPSTPFSFALLYPTALVNTNASHLRTSMKRAFAARFAPNQLDDDDVMMPPVKKQKQEEKEREEKEEKKYEPPNSGEYQQPQQLLKIDVAMRRLKRQRLEMDVCPIETNEKKMDSLYSTEGVSKEFSVANEPDSLELLEIVEKTMSQFGAREFYHPGIVRSMMAYALKKQATMYENQQSAERAAHSDFIQDYVKRQDKGSQPSYIG